MELGDLIIVRFVLNVQKLGVLNIELNKQNKKNIFMYK